MSSIGRSTFLLFLLLGNALSFCPIQRVAPRATPRAPYSRQTRFAESNTGPELTTTRRRREPANVVDSAFQEFAHRIASTFQAREFRPSPSLTNCHLQTISGVFLRSDPDCRYIQDNNSSAGDENFKAVGKGVKLLKSISGEPDTYGDFWDVRQTIDTPDGDFFHVDYKYHSSDSSTTTTTMMSADPSSKGLVVILHGLQSNSNSSLSVDLGKAYRQQGFDVACINFRGCSGVPNDSLRAYHLGFTDDLMHYLSLLNRGAKKPPPIFLSGFSLGANVVLKALGEMGPSAFRDYNIYGAAVSGAPFDNERNIQFVQKAGFNKIAYNGSLLKSMKRTALLQMERFPDSPEAQKLDYEAIASTTEISGFENAVIAPIFGFDDNIDYYRKNNCLIFLDAICVPTFVLNAADDPFFDPAFFPWEKGCDSLEGQNTQSPIKLKRTDHGGHLGYMFHQISDSDKDNNQDVSFMPFELSRFINHVFERRTFLERGEVARQYFQINQVGTFSDMMET